MKIRTIKIILLFLLFIDLWAYKSLIEKVYKNDYGFRLYKTLVIFKGEQNKIAKSKWVVTYTVEELLYDFFSRTDIISLHSHNNGSQFEILVTTHHEKTKALRYLKEGIEEGEVYVDEKNYLVTK